MPGVVMGKALAQRGDQVRYFGEGKAIEDDLSKAQSVDLIRPSVGGGRFSRGRTLWNLLSSQQPKPDLCLGFGGFSTAVLGTWAIVHRVPFVLFEQNAIAGRVNRLLRPFAKAIHLTFPAENLRGGALWGNPVRQAPAQSETEMDLLILGGSQGAKALNINLPSHLPQDLRITHIAGPGRVEEALGAHGGPREGLEVLESHPDVPSLLARSRWVISRAGATSLSEIAAGAKACITVPYPHAKDDHQRANARHLEKLGAVRVLEEADFSRVDLKAWLADEDLRTKLVDGMAKSGLADVGGVRNLKALP